MLKNSMNFKINPVGFLFNELKFKLPVFGLRRRGNNMNHVDLNNTDLDHVSISLSISRI